MTPTHQLDGSTASGAPATAGASPVTRALALTVAVLLAAFVGLVGMERPAAAQTAASRGALFDGTPDVTLPATSALTQLFADANDGYVHFPFGASNLASPLLAGSTFNGLASLPDGRSLTVRTGASVSGYTGQIVFSDRIAVGLSPSRDAAQCDFGVLTPELASEPSAKNRVALTYAVGDENTPGPKLGYLRIEPTVELGGNYVCMRRETQVLEVANSSPKYYDLQYSPVVVSNESINVGFIGSRSDPARVEEEGEEEPEAQPAAEEEAVEADAEAEEEEAEAEEQAGDADDTAETDADEEQAGDADEADADSAEEADADAEGDAEADDAAETDDDASDASEGSSEEAEVVTAADDEDAGSTLVPALLGVIAVLLAGLLLVLARRRPEAQPAATPAAPAAAPATASAATTTATPVEESPATEVPGTEVPGTDDVAEDGPDVPPAGSA